MADPTFIAAATTRTNYPIDNVLNGTAEQSYTGTPLGLIYQQLKIITILLREGFGINELDEDVTLLGQAPQILNPPLTPPTL